MNPRYRIRTPALIASCLTVLLCLAVAPGPASAQEPLTVILGARVFTGDEVLEVATVTLRGQEIESVDLGAAIPTQRQDGGTLIDGRGMTILPGLIDAHTHSFGPVLEHALNFGVTTVLDMFTEPTTAARWRREQTAGDAAGRSDLFSAGFMVTVAGGHGTQFGIQTPTLDDPEQTEAFIAARVAEGADYIKVVYEHGGHGFHTVPTHEVSTLPRIVAAAHAHDKLAVFHVSTADEAAEAIAAGADGLVHVYRDRAGLEDVVPAAARAGIFVVPTLAVAETFFRTRGAAELAADPAIAPFLTVAQRSSLALDVGTLARPDRYQAVLETVGALHAAGVPILAGTDSLNPGTAHGASLHREMEQLVNAGLSPVEALRAATAAAADAFGLADRGRIAPGRKADLILVRGDPTREIRATRELEAIWKDGVRFERQRAQAPVGRPRVTPRLLTGFEDVTTDTLAANGWLPSTDTMAGGNSAVELSVTPDGADRSAGALRITGEMASGFAFPWAGVMISLGPGMMQPVDASDIARLVFDARGEGRTYRVMAFAESLGRVPATVGFDASGDWSRIEIPLESFPSLDPSGAIAFLIGGPADLGPFRLEIDNVELRD